LQHLPHCTAKLERKELRIGIILSGGNLDPEVIPAQPGYGVPQRKQMPKEESDW